MGITVVAEDIPGIKKNSIYFSGLDNGSTNPDHIFVFDLTTSEIEPLPQCSFLLCSLVLPGPRRLVLTVQLASSCLSLFCTSKW